MIPAPKRRPANSARSRAQATPIRNPSPALSAALRQIEEITRPPAARPLPANPLILCWHRALDNLMGKLGGHGRRLREASFAFILQGDWCERAVHAGWSEGDLFALDAGLVPCHLARGARILDLTSEAAQLIDGSSRRRVARPMTDAEAWWNDPRVVWRIDTRKKDGKSR